MQILFTQEQIKDKVKELARQIKKDHPEKVFCLVVLKGALVFFADLIRELAQNKVKVEFDTVQLSSYVQKEHSGEIKIKKDIKNIENKDVLIVEDIVDTGLGLTFLKNYLLKEKKACSVKICSLTSKPSGRKIPIKIDYLGFEVPEKFIVGYGIDYNEQYRELPFIGAID